jgi:hypothetical protein
MIGNRHFKDGKMITWMTSRRGKTLEAERGSNVENLLWKRLWVCREADCGRNTGDIPKHIYTLCMNYCL